MKISIHALRGEGDIDYKDLGHYSIISIHALRGEGDNALPTVDFGAIDISIHALRGEGDYSIENSLILLDISIHALRGEGDFTWFFFI